jgi:hypothetical protein
MKKAKTIINALSSADLLMGIVTGLEDSYYKVDMDTFGRITKDGVCIGCAATNAITILTGVKLKFAPKDKEAIFESKGVIWAQEKTYLRKLEVALDCLRKGNILAYNIEARKYSFPVIKNMYYNLPCLTNSTYKSKIIAYKKLADLERKTI